MAINKLISIKEPIIEVADDMGFDLTRDRPTFMLWAVRAEKDIGSYYSFKRRRAVLDIVGCTAKLPCSAAFLKVAVIGDYGCECEELMSNLCTWASTINISSTETFLVIDKPDSGVSFSLAGLKYEIQDNQIVFANNLNGQKVTVEYLGFEEDCDGYPMVSENHKNAIMEYIMYRFCVRSRFSPNKMELGDMKFHKDEYNRFVSDARALDAQLTESERARIVALIHDPFSGYGLDIGITQYQESF